MTNPVSRITRLAPSPTGALHLGNARTFLINWALARGNASPSSSSGENASRGNASGGWSIVLRIEDLDGPRVKSGACEQAVEDLRWLGLDWDQGPFYQRTDLTPYRAALDQLAQAGLLYPCGCTRSEILRAQSAPHADEHELRYPGTCRPRAAVRPNVALDQGLHAWRLLTPDRTIAFTDQVHGPQQVNVQQQVGDFLVATRAGVPAYQLAVVVDDARQGVTDVIRGDDLLSSTARQILLYQLLGLTPHAGPPRYWHLPLVLGPDGRRLAKRHGDTRLAWYRQQGVAPERLIGLLAYWSGMTSRRVSMSALDFAQAFRIEQLPKQPATFTPEDHQWLLQS